MNLKLVVRYLGVVVFRKELPPGEYLLGRSPSADILLTQDFISRRHGKIFFDKGSWYYRDLRTNHPNYSSIPRAITDSEMIELENDIDILTEEYLFLQDTGEYNFKDLKTMSGRETRNRRRINLLVFVALFLFLVGIGISLLYLLQKPMEVEELLSFVRPKIVELEKKPSEKAVRDFKLYAGLRDSDFLESDSFCSGFIIAPDVILTASHCLNQGMMVDLDPNFNVKTHDGKRHKIKRVLGLDVMQDYVFLEVPGIDSYGYLDLEGEYNVGQTVYTVGNVGGEGIAIREGIIANTTKDKDNPNVEYIRYSAPASPGNSGGPLIDGYGKVVALVFAKSGSENYNLGTSSKYLIPGIKRFVEKRTGEKLLIQPKYLHGSMQIEMFLSLLGIPFGYEWKDYPEDWQPLEQIKTEIMVPCTLSEYAHSVILGLNQSAKALYDDVTQKMIQKGRNIGYWESKVSPTNLLVVPSARRLSRMLKGSFMRPVLFSLLFPGPLLSVGEEFHADSISAKLTSSEDRMNDCWEYAGAEYSSHVASLNSMSYSPILQAHVCMDDISPDESRKIVPSDLLARMLGRTGMVFKSGECEFLRPSAKKEFTINKFEETPTAQPVEDAQGRKWDLYSFSLFEDNNIDTYCLPLPQGHACLSTVVETPSDELLQIRRDNYQHYTLSNYVLEPLFWRLPALLDFYKSGMADRFWSFKDFRLEPTSSGELRILLASLGVEFVLPKSHNGDMVLPLTGIYHNQGNPKWIGLGVDVLSIKDQMVCSVGVQIVGTHTKEAFVYQKNVAPKLMKNIFLEDAYSRKISAPIQIYSYCQHSDNFMSAFDGLKGSSPFSVRYSVQ